MTSEQRQAIRRALTDAGLQRLMIGPDTGDGVYSEFWCPREWDSPSRPGVRIVVRWGPRTSTQTSARTSSGKDN